jgi:hypothetical protein
MQQYRVNDEHIHIEKMIESEFPTRKLLSIVAHAFRKPYLTIPKHSEYSDENVFTNQSQMARTSKGDSIAHIPSWPEIRAFEFCFPIVRYQGEAVTASNLLFCCEYHK